MKIIELRFSQLKNILFLMGIFLLISSCETSTKYKDLPIQSISKSEIIAFQKAFGISFNGIANAIESETYYELKAKKHIEKFYNFKEGEVMFKIGNDDDKPFRYTHEGLLSYLIGKSKKFPNDVGLAKGNWRKFDWNNMGIIMEGNIAIVIGRVTLENENDTILQNYTMVLKRNEDGALKIITHKISTPC